MRISNLLSFVSCCAISSTIFTTPLAAQDQAVDEVLGPRISVELNAAQAQEKGCKLSFLVLNGHQKDISKTVLETVIFDKSGQVNRMTLFDFGALPQGRPRVRQFVIPATQCNEIGQILFNGAQTCEGSELPEGACMKEIRLNSRTDIAVLG